MLMRYELRREQAADSTPFNPLFLLEIIMPTTQSATTRKTATHKTTTRRSKNDAIKLLTDDHAKVKKMFKEFEKLHKKNEEGKEELAQQICKELTIHAQLEEEIFYPAAREAIDDDHMMNEAAVEHQAAKDMIAKIQSMNSSDPMYDALVTVLAEYVNHHVEEEQNEIFPKVEKAKVDLEEIGSEIAERKEALMGEQE
jgi:hemerythrin superfamily protein